MNQISSSVIMMMWPSFRKFLDHFISNFDFSFKIQAKTSTSALVKIDSFKQLILSFIKNGYWNHVSLLSISANTWSAG